MLVWKRKWKMKNYTGNPPHMRKKRKKSQRCYIPKVKSKPTVWSRFQAQTWVQSLDKRCWLVGKMLNTREMIIVDIAGCRFAFRPFSTVWLPFCVIAALRLFIKRHWGRNKPSGDRILSDGVYSRYNAVILEMECKSWRQERGMWTLLTQILSDEEYILRVRFEQSFAC